MHIGSLLGTLSSFLTVTKVELFKFCPKIISQFSLLKDQEFDLNKQNLHQTTTSLFNFPQFDCLMTFNFELNNFTRTGGLFIVKCLCSRGQE